MSNQQAEASRAPPPQRWYQSVNRYQWLVLVIASAAWVFDAYEGQVYNITRQDMLTEILHSPSDPKLVARHGDEFLGVFLAGGAIGGILFGSLSDRFGRKPVMVVTILFYSLFAGLTYFVTQLWQIGVLRFFVGMGVGGGWAVAATLVAEVFPRHARAHASGIFHATSTFGTWLATAVGLAVHESWRYAYLISVVPALLVLWVWMSVEEPQTWATARRKVASGMGGKLGSFVELFSHRVWGPRVILGTILATVGLGTFWGVTVAGQDLVKDLLVRTGNLTDVGARAKFAYGVVETSGMFLGLLSFGPLCVQMGRRWTFILLQAGSLVIVPITCYLPATYAQLVLLLPLYGFFTLSIHAGFAIYFPELFPSNLRSTAAGFCFNAGRLTAAPILFLVSARLKETLDLRLAITLMSLMFVIGIVVVLFLPETKGQPLPE